MSSIAERQILIGLETYPGTGVTVDTAIRAKASLKAMPDKIVVDEDINSFAPQRHYIGSLHAEGSLDFDAYYEQAAYPVAMAMGPGVKTGGPATYTWTFDLPYHTEPDFATFTVEYTDGANHIVHSEDVFAKTLEISGEAGKSWAIKADLLGANTTFPGAVGASLTAPQPVIPIRMADTTLTIGSDDVPVLISFDWKLENLQHQKLFGGSVYPTGRGHDKWTVTLELIVEAEDSYVNTIKATLLNTTTTHVILAATDGTYSFTIDGYFMLNEVDTLDDRDGNNILKLTFLGMGYNDTDAGGIVVVSTQSAL